MKFIAKVFVPMYVVLEAENVEEAKKKSIVWYKENKQEWREPQVEVLAKS